MKSLVVGMGIGNLYKNVLAEMGYDVVTVDPDPNKNATYTDLEQALEAHLFDTAHVCTPNYTHQTLAELIAPHANIVFVEKPGFKTAEDWKNTCERFPQTRFMMVKNNMWRDNIQDLIRQAHASRVVKLLWHNKNRIPSPGSWFTTRELAYGGVSRDLLPHLLSFLVAFEPNITQVPKFRNTTFIQNYKLEDIKDTDYGQVNSSGIYDVDDSAQAQYEINDRRYYISASWKYRGEDDRTIYFSDDIRASSEITNKYEFGLCPESAYKSMIQDAIQNLDNNEYWQRQLEIDTWIHTQIES